MTFSSALAEALAPDVLERFQRYVRVGTQSDVSAETSPSTRGQLDLALRPAVGRNDLVGGPAGAQQAGQQRLPHHPGAQDGQPAAVADRRGHRFEPAMLATSWRLTSSAIWTALSAAPLRRLSLLMNITRPLPVGAD